MTEIALLDPAALTDRDIAAVEAATGAFYSQLATLEGSYITRSQRHHLAGLVIFSRTGALCTTLFWVIIQIVVVAGGAYIILRGIVGFFSKPATAGKARSLNQLIIDTASTPEGVTEELDRLTEDASPEDLVQIRDYLEKLQREGGFVSGEERRKAQAAIDAIDKKLNQ